MAIDITSISTGISSQSITGPLAPLQTSGPKLSPLQYPSDLGSSTKNHYVKFTIRKVDPSQPVTGLLSGGANLTSITTAAKDLMDKVTQTYFNTPTQTTKDVICLYMPDTLSSSYDADYQELTLTNDLGKGLVAIQAIEAVRDLMDSKGSKNFAGVTSADPMAIYTAGQALSWGLAKFGLEAPALTDVALQTQGYAVNPQLQVIYRGLGFRNFTLNFIFTPASEEEALKVNQIIGKFKYHFAPQMVLAKNAVSGMFFVPPSFFNIEFMFNANENKFLPRYGDCVLTNIDVNYAPSGFAAHNDGAPVQTQLTLQFREIEVVTKDKLSEGFNADKNSPTNTSPSGIAGLR